MCVSGGWWEGGETLTSVQTQNTAHTHTVRARVPTVAFDGKRHVSCVVKLQKTCTESLLQPSLGSIQNQPFWSSGFAALMLSHDTPGLS